MVTAGCSEPPDADTQKTKLQKAAFRDYLLGRWTYTVIDEYRDSTRPKRPSNLVSLSTFQSAIYGEPSCRRNRIITQHSDIGARSTCPWFVVLDVDFQREPQTIARARCSCKRCYSIDRSGKSRARCTEVNSYIPVIKWRCPSRYTTGDHYYEYFIDLETVPVGCTCKRSRNVVS